MASTLFLSFTSFTLVQVLLLLLLCVFTSAGQKEQAQAAVDESPVYIVDVDEYNIVRISKLKIMPDDTQSDTPVVAEFVLPLDAIPGGKLSYDVIKKRVLQVKGGGDITESADDTTTDDESGNDIQDDVNDTLEDGDDSSNSSSSNNNIRNINNFNNNDNSSESNVSGLNTIINNIGNNTNDSIRSNSIGSNSSNNNSSDILNSGSNNGSVPEEGLYLSDDVNEVTQRIQREIDGFVQDYKRPVKATKEHKIARQSTAAHIIELLLVVDYSLYSTFLVRNGNILTNAVLDIQTYYSQILRATNERFATAASGSFSVTLTISGIFITQTDALSPWTELFRLPNGYVNPLPAAPSFAAFALGLNTTLPHDLPVLLTGYSLAPDGVTVVPGFTPLPGLLCSILGTLWLTDTLDERTSLNLARYISDSIGIQRDGPNGCDPNLLNIMTTSNLLPTSVTLASNPWSFSSCSASQLASQLDNSALTSCTLGVSNLIPFNPLPFLTQLFGQQYDADLQCANSQRLFSKFCRDNYFSPNTLTFDPDMCYNLRCLSAAGTTCQQTIAHDGTSCGDRKICLKGLCTTNIFAPFRPINCPQLDDPYASCTFASCLNPTIAAVSCCGTCNGIIEPSTVGFPQLDPQKAASKTANLDFGDSEDLLEDDDDEEGLQSFFY